MLASVCKTVCFFGVQYASMGVLVISFFICVNADCCFGPQLKGTLSFENSLMGSAILDNLAENFDK